MWRVMMLVRLINIFANLREKKTNKYEEHYEDKNVFSDLFITLHASAFVNEIFYNGWRT